MPNDQTTRRLWCVECSADVSARLTDGREIYPCRPDLAALPFWKCDDCQNAVGCHHKTQDRTRPLGVIPSEEMKAARQYIHSLIDPLWKDGRLSRRHIYARLTLALGRQYHTGELRTLDEARMIYREAQQIAKEANNNVAA